MVIEPRVLSTDHVSQSEDPLVGPTTVEKTLPSKFVCERVAQSITLAQDKNPIHH